MLRTRGTQIIAKVFGKGENFPFATTNTFCIIDLFVIKVAGLLFLFRKSPSLALR